MNLILQSLDPSPASIKHVATLAQAQHTTPINQRAWRCEGVNFSHELKAQIDAACLAAHIDYAFVPPGRTLSDFKLLVMDMDSTLITIECIDEIADMHGLKPQVAAITEAAMRGEIEFRESLTRRVALLTGLDASALQRVYDERLRLSPGAERMLATVQTAGLKTLLVSGGFTFFTKRIQARLGLNFSHANELEAIDGKLTGRVLGEIVDADGKCRAVERVCTELGIQARQAIVLGDGA
ncbi:MAG: phosphoserine phosphatase SerB, partial [Gallionellales bacterium RBG_16_56_9]